MRRYATVFITSLNGGSGRAVRNFRDRYDFGQFWADWVRRFPLPECSSWQGLTGSIGDGTIGIQYRIYATGENPHVRRSLESRLLEYKNKLHLERGEPIQLHAFDSWKPDWFVSGLGLGYKRGLV